VIGTTPTREKAASARAAGANIVILYTEQDFLEEVKRITGGRGVNVVYDSVGHDTFDRSLTPLGTLASYAQSSSFPASTVFNMAAAGTLNLRIGGAYPLAQAAEVHIALASRQTTGKLVLLP
jgi:NADPH2:quinone reductase